MKFKYIYIYEQEKDVQESILYSFPFQFSTIFESCVFVRRMEKLLYSYSIYRSILHM